MNILVGCVAYYKDYNDFIDNVKPSEIQTTVVHRKFISVKQDVASNLKRCFEKSNDDMYHAKCKIQHATSTYFEVSCTKMWGYFKEDNPAILYYVKLQKVDATHTKANVYTLGIGTTSLIMDWVQDNHQMCPSIM
jgi:hypothetical protein